MYSDQNCMVNERLEDVPEGLSSLRSGFGKGEPHVSTHATAPPTTEELAVAGQALVADLDRRLRMARPSLLRLARSYGLAPEVAEDVVQEVCVLAWRHVGDMRNPDRFDAWLARICRNACRMQIRSERTQRCAVVFSSLPSAPVLESNLSSDVSSPMVADPREGAFVEDEIIRRDTQREARALVARALAYLSPELREVVELCYLAERPRGDVARTLQLSASALDARLHRARKSLRAIVHEQLRVSAAALDLPLALPEGWRETREWCHFCGRHVMHGRLEALPAGGINLEMTCPDCGFTLNSGCVVPITALRAFRPALHRALIWTATFLRAKVTAVEQLCPCPVCGQPTQLRLRRPEQRVGTSSLTWAGSTLMTACGACGSECETPVSTAAFAHPRVRAFVAHHPRWIVTPERFLEHARQPAIRICLTDASSADQVQVLLHAQTLRVLHVVDD